MSLGEEVYESGFEQGEISRTKEMNVDHLAKLSKKVRIIP